MTPLANQLQDMDIDCADCGQTFTWTADQQAFYRERQLSQPKRCKSCRDARKAKYDGQPRNGRR